MAKLILKYQDTMDNIVTFKIEEQTYIGDAFGNNTNYYKHFNGVTLKSMESPIAYVYEINDIMVYCRGRNTEGNNYSLTAPTEHWEKIKEAVRGYNKHFGYYGNCILGEVIKNIVPMEMFVIE